MEGHQPAKTTTLHADSEGQELLQANIQVKNGRKLAKLERNKRIGGIAYRYEIKGGLSMKSKAQWNREKVLKTKRRTKRNHQSRTPIHHLVSRIVVHQEKVTIGSTSPALQQGEHHEKASVCPVWRKPLTRFVSLS
jgi:hypothetical protein